MVLAGSDSVFRDGLAEVGRRAVEWIERAGR